MVTSLTNAAGMLARFFLAATALFFSGPRLLAPATMGHPVATRQRDTRPGGEKTGFHAELTVGRGKRQVTVELEFGDARERAERESL